MAEGETNHFGFSKLPDGHMVFAKDINDILDDIDQKLYDARFSGVLAEAGAAAATPVGAAVWTQVVFDDEQEIIFPSEIEFLRARILVTNAAALAANVVDLALAVASAPGVPISTTASFDSSGGDLIVTPLPGLPTIPPTEELILVQKDNADVGFGPSAIDVQVTAEVKKAA